MTSAVRRYAVVGLVALASCDTSSPSRDRAAIAVAAVQADLIVTVPARGEIAAVAASPIAVPSVPTGALKVKEVVEEGSIIAAGDVVLVFDATELSIELKNHRASLSSAGRRIDKTGLTSRIEASAIEVMASVAELERANADAFRIVDDGLYSKLEQLDNQVAKEEAEGTILYARAALLLRGEYYDIEERILEVEKRQVEGRIGRVETSLASLVLQAPIGGLVVYKKNWRGGIVSVGDTLWPGNVVLSIVDPAKTKLDAFLLQRDAAQVEVGDEATITVDTAPGRSFSGKVATVADISRPIEENSPVKYTEVSLTIDEPDPLYLKPGIKGEARIVTDRVDATVVIPRTAVGGQNGSSWVQVVTPSGTERRTIVTGAADRARVAVQQGLAAGELVLLAPTSSSASGQTSPSGT